MELEISVKLWQLRSLLKENKITEEAYVDYVLQILGVVTLKGMKDVQDWIEAEEK